MVFVLQNLGHWQDAIFLLVIFFFCQSNSEGNQRTSLLYSSGGIMQKARAELGHYSLSVITFRPNVQEPEKKKRESFILILPSTQTLGVG